jgi:hypothetical protein
METIQLSIDESLLVEVQQADQRAAYDSIRFHEGGFGKGAATTRGRSLKNDDTLKAIWRSLSKLRKSKNGKVSKIVVSHETGRRVLVYVPGSRQALIGGCTPQMVKRLNNSDRMTRDIVAEQPRRELMKECLRKAEEIRLRLEGRQHRDSTNLIAEDRTTPQ